MSKQSRAGGLFVIFFLAASTSFGQMFVETFEGGIPASWTKQDNFPIPGSPDFSAVPWTTNGPEGMLNYTNGGGATGTGTAATASSKNHPGQYDVSLISPSFLIAAGVGGDNVSYTINFQRVDAFEAFDTNVSLNGGPWLLLTHDTSSLGPAYGTGPPKITRGIDLDFAGAMPGDVARLEFRYYSTFLLPMVRNEYVQIDDVTFPTTPVPEPTSLAALLLAAGFAAMARRR